MKKKRPKRQSSKPPPAPALQYRVVELSTVDERSLELTLNEWAGRGWTLDGIQFAMRESSKRPSMAFVLFTREGAEEEPDRAAARERLRRLAGPAVGEGEPSRARGEQRLVQLAEGDE
jgi:hypothetical protein